MATKAKDGKETHGKKVVKSSTSIPSSPDKVPGYLRKTASSVKDPSSKPTGKKPIVDDPSPKPTNRRKSLDKPPSQSQLQRTLSSNSRTPRTSSPSPKVTSSSPRPGSGSAPKKSVNSSPKPVVSSDKIISKPVVEKTLKITPRVVKSASLHKPAVIAKTKTFKRTTSNVSSSSSKQHDAKDDTSPTITTTTTTTTDVVQVSGIDVEQEDKTIMEQEVVDGGDTLKIEEHEETLLDHDNEDEHMEEDEQTPAEIIEPTMEVEEHEEEEVKMPSPPAEETQEETIDQIQIEEEHPNEEQEVITEDKKDIENEPEIEEKTEVVPEENVEEVITEEPVIVTGDVKSPGSENEETKAYKMKFRQRKESEDGEEEMKDEAGNLVLRKQEVNKGKKESQAYNDVIEETRSKLVGRQKSKVRALVGAFETVISLEGTDGQ